ncbi:hypothetical protein PV08_02745 [Exophiala spinifera]|uniref:Xylanolytic transcriptional activator regulatory domain-containing protein n=1 Tax=Exophiala spinifera TaxID=91928 RepID=A0A0D2A0F0_9EURO|nr:uncharacterized protein PV08_02745 [Exophiala spinifera]KIW18457.1 hypothetical protein PV08_02745 [Exophiala spinifera]
MRWATPSLLILPGIQLRTIIPVRNAKSRSQKSNSVCEYRKVADPPPTKLESEITTIKDRLGNIEHLLAAQKRPAAIHRDVDSLLSPHATSTSTPAPIVALLEGAQSQSPCLSDSPGFPVMVIRNKSFMHLVGVEIDLAAHLAKLERLAGSKTVGENGRHFLLQQSRAINALNAFFEEIHPWYPILDSQYQVVYAAVMDGDLKPSSESCLALIVAALGSLSSHDVRGKHTMYADMALSMLARIIADCSVLAVEALVYIAVYYCCLCSPLEAFEYNAIASLKAQSLLTVNRCSVSEADSEALRRAFWAILLIESELCVQLELIDTGVWNLDESTMLPKLRDSWSTSPQLPFYAQPDGDHTANLEDIDAYFLAEIAMRRISHRAPSAIRGTSRGELVYAPIVASELNYQLDEWYHHLPSSLKFHRGHQAEMRDHRGLVLFLRTQYYSCMTSIYWPAVYKVIQTGRREDNLHLGCQKFFDAYYDFLLSATVCLQHCTVNKWTLLASIFAFTMAAARAMKEPALADAVPPRLFASLTHAVSSLASSVHCGPSLSYMHNLLKEHLTGLVGFSPEQSSQTSRSTPLMQRPDFT